MTVIIYDDLIEEMKQHGITSYTIKADPATGKDAFMSQGSYTRMKFNRGYIGLEIIEKLLNEMQIEKIEIVKVGNDYKILIPQTESAEG